MTLKNVKMPFVNVKMGGGGYLHKLLKSTLLKSALAALLALILPLAAANANIVPSQIIVSTAPTGGDCVLIDANAATAVGINTTGGGSDDTTITVNGGAATSGVKGVSVTTPVINFSGFTLTSDLTGLQIRETGTGANDNWSSVHFYIGDITLRGSNISSNNFTITGLDTRTMATDPMSWIIGTITIESDAGVFGINASQNINVRNNVSATSTNIDAVGIRQTSGSSLVVDNSSVTATAYRYATGISSFASDLNIAGTISAVATSQTSGSAVGIQQTSGGGNNTFLQFEGSVTANARYATGISTDTEESQIRGAVNAHSTDGDAYGIYVNGNGKLLTVYSAVSAQSDNAGATGVYAVGSTVNLRRSAAVTAAAGSVALGVRAQDLILNYEFNNLGNKFTAEATGTVSLGEIDLTGLTNSSIKANNFVLDGNFFSSLTGKANIADVIIDGNNSAVTVDLMGYNFAAASNINNGSGLIINDSIGSGIAELLGLADSFTLAGGATVQIDGSNFTNSDTITIDGTSAVLVVGGTGTTFNGDVATTATAKLASANGADITDSGIQVQSASGTYTWGAVEDPNNLGDWYIAVLGIKPVSTNSNATEVAHLLHDKYTVWRAVQDHLISNTNRNGTPVGARILGQSPCDPCGSILGTAARTAWVNYVGRSNSYYDTAFQSNWKIGTDGLQIGSDLYRTKKTQFGVLFGYEDGNATVLTDAVKSDDVYAGFYGVRVFGNGSDARLIFNKGWQDFDLSRSAGAATAAFKGETTEVTLEWGRRFNCYGWSFRPAAALDYFGSDTDGFTEAGSGDVYAKSYFSQTFFRFGSDLRYEEGRFALNGGLYYSYDLHGDTLATTLNGITNASLGSDLGRSVLTFKVGGSYLFGKSFTVFSGYQCEALLDADKNGVQHIGHAGGAWKW